MVKHVVMFKLHNYAEGSSKKENAVKIKKVLDKLPSQIPIIKSYEVGLNINNSSRAYDIVVISLFETQIDLEVYLNHPAHLKAVQVIEKYREESVVVDFLTI